jgi:hypothetical protein
MRAPTREKMISIMISIMALVLVILASQNVLTSLLTRNNFRYQA